MWLRDASRWTTISRYPELVKRLRFEHETIECPVVPNSHVQAHIAEHMVGALPLRCAAQLRRRPAAARFESPQEPAL